MNDKIELKIIELIDDGATLENSSELKDIVETSEEAKLFYNKTLASFKLLSNYFATDEFKDIDNSAKSNVLKRATKFFKISSPVTKSITGFAIAASFAAIAFTFFNSSDDIDGFVDLPLLAYEETMPLMDEVISDPEQLFISGEDLRLGLWGPSSKLAKQIGRNRYEIMYVIFEANKEGFIDNNINQPIYDREFRVDLSLVENLDTDFVIDEVKRHIFCSC
tara:strand:+ start:634 stop:1296 length:663 start_codon:yes stop_codon:yes gene_type:complete